MDEFDNLLYFFPDPFVEAYFDQLDEATRTQAARYDREITDDMVRNAVDISRAYPTLAPEVVASAAVVGAAPSPAMDEIAKAGVAADSANIWDDAYRLFKGGVRNAFTVFDAAWEEGFTRPFRAVVAWGSQGPTANEMRDLERFAGVPEGSFGKRFDITNIDELQAFRRASEAGMEFSQSGMSFGEAYRRAGPSHLRMAVESGGPLNTGTGFIPRSTEPEDFPEYAGYIADRYTPEQARQQVIAEKGAPVTRLAAEQANSLLYRGMPISPGRVFAGHVPVEPGTVPYNMISGAVDFAAQVALDPAARVFTGFGRQGSLIPGINNMRRATRTLSGLGDIEDLRPGLGLISGRRQSVFRPSFEQKMTSGQGLRLQEVLRNLKPEDTAYVVRMLSRRNRHVHRGTIRRIVEGDDPYTALKELVVGATGRSGARQGGGAVEWFTPTSLTSSLLERAGIGEGGTISSFVGGLLGGDLGRVGGWQVGLRIRTDQWGLGRLMAKMPGRSLNVEDLDNAIVNYDDFLRSGGLDSTERSGFLYEMTKLSDDATIEDVQNIHNRALEVMRVKMAERLMRPGMWQAARGQQLAAKEADRLARAMTQSFKKLDDVRKYATDDVTNALITPASRLHIWLGEKMGTVLPSAHLMTEFLKANIPLPDARAMRKSFSRTRRLALYRNFNGKSIDEVFGPGVLEAFADPIMQRFWKPMTLLRIAWPARVLGEEQFRVAAAGMDSLFRHPLSALSYMIADPSANGLTRVLRRAGIKPRGQTGVMTGMLRRTWRAEDLADARKAVADAKDAMVRRAKAEGVEGLTIDELAAAHPEWAGDYLKARGELDEFDAMLEAANLAEADILLGLSDEAKASMTARGEPFMGHSRSGYYRDGFTRYNKQQAEYAGSWHEELRQLYTDEIAPRIVRDGLDKTQDWLAGRGRWEGKPDPVARDIRRRMRENNRAWNRIADDTRPNGGLDKYVESVWARIQIKTGGQVNVMFLESPGKLIKLDADRLPKAYIDAVEAGEWHRLIYQQGARSGNEDLLELIGSGYWGSTDLRKLEGGAEAVKQFRADLRAKYLEAGPEYVKGVRHRRAGKAGQTLDNVIDDMFSLLMSKPTNFLSRHPAFAQFYWQKAEQMIGFASAEVQAQILKAAQDARLPRSTLRRMAKAMKQTEASRISRVGFTADKARRIQTIREMDSYELVEYLGRDDIADILLPAVTDDANVTKLLTMAREGAEPEQAVHALIELWRRMPDDPYTGQLIRWTLTRTPRNGEEALGDLVSRFDEIGMISQPEHLDLLAGAATVSEFKDAVQELAKQALASRITRASKYPKMIRRQRLGLAAEVIRSVRDELDDLADQVPFDRLRQLFLGEQPRGALALDLSTQVASLVDEFEEAIMAATRNRAVQDAARKTLTQRLKRRGVRHYNLGATDLDELGFFPGYRPARGIGHEFEEGIPGRGNASYFEHKGYEFSSSDELLDFANRRGWNRQELGEWLQDTDPAPGLSRFAKDRVSRAMEDERFIDLADEMDEFLELADAGSAWDEITSLEDIDRIAKQAALLDTKGLLYDTTRKSQFMDAYRNLFPFGEAWIEILTTWAKLMYENPEIFRRGQQVIEGARGSGFLMTDPETGEEMFNYPASGLLASLASKLMDLPGISHLMPGSGVSDLLAEGDPSELIFQGRLQGLNLIAGQYLPGLGPLVQLPASYILDFDIFDDIIAKMTPWEGVEVRDWFRERVLPFGDLRFAGFLGLETIGQMTPPWLQRFLSTVNASTEHFERIKLNTTIDVMKALLLQGQLPNSVEAAQDLVRRASGMADQLTHIRSIAQFMGPTGPEVKFYSHVTLPPGELAKLFRPIMHGYTPEQRDELEARIAAAPDHDAAMAIAEEAGIDIDAVSVGFGNMWLYQSLSGIYREKLFGAVEDGGFAGDDTKAFQWFIDTFGMEPTLFATPKTTQIQRRHTTAPGDQWARTHRDLFEVAPLTAYYAHPDVETERFDYNAYMRQLEEEARIGLTPTQWLSRRNDTLGHILYERFRQDADVKFGEGSSDTKRRALEAVRLWIGGEFPGYLQPEPGAPQTPSTESQIRELVEVWPNHPELRDSEAGQAMTLYAQMREALMEKSRSRGLMGSSWATAATNEDLQDLMRRYALALAKEYSDFAHLWTLVLSHELRWQPPEDTEATVGTTPPQPGAEA